MISGVKLQKCTLKTENRPRQVFCRPVNQDSEILNGLPSLCFAYPLTLSSLQRGMLNIQPLLGLMRTSFFGHSYPAISLCHICL
ncbi:MAG: hypothetical protein UU67_C0068G0012 [Candidatus Daviesbacteria bacterium GW2011_GWB1_41_5]|uniref:Uncharacterized protein n=1 Tax=Candidatus Daviesbacteria bacterium GW2011_GWB1_41_5 TaxID=1618429 RepID=A0A0G0WFH3_9BACT|nr:MAG: hypothetical protein UU67_C0068G0012 [Candidatus Daviesbacteria bacterium GW2011_GWB1_41_5]